MKLPRLEIGPLSLGEIEPVKDLDDAAERNREMWKRRVEEGMLYTRPWLDLDPAVLHAFIRKEIDELPDPCSYIYPSEVLENVEGKEVLCLASGGGQQSAVFGLLGAHVHVVDLSPEQLEGDRKAAKHYGYPIVTIEADMRRLSILENESIDLIYQAISLPFVPDARDVYREAARLLKPEGRYRVGHCNPATYGVDPTFWNGEFHKIKTPYHGGGEGAGQRTRASMDRLGENDRDMIL
ncbi:MAG: class I SAM-dependent methyltransferase [Candidatus Eisenbacteria bacterium]|uniref:Class I SAM-dependent methyltransferase n=1 Tax=Eiseniibacteriota bacterium TaxID=2212470 RepID=A0A948S0S0_UNCEI|nr:class I SAM-dependent methyltransferase [Candidatus Eisenbacteria bacterium]MBU1947508.1 class I SAM-dependent methyltransferase [Candidatus Eisenbacteria bacterium]MBU2691729.1 class I SAM-dependent methyltransferase [Candidatus Eisenbacteria bacterium]